ncbi:aminopeptidase P N-terminal domain-containing protein [Aureibaculum sp. 2210JD6-5]|uniref:aminopeptidase P N-terminal domain-containing protein n=1 Tax=Aureibaculum sp. 2210JD6-5 TaxID=3103957 RepID=UPI002AAD321F|nr:aminopeptidase P N-terminal domain-containing protein [Aureibaculum sp. 2210JD6-5]MDY7395509.1 aminopeptidase P N-terminal domain-containing protein [Aureibaculum sp. 2210JD6-5]
MKSIVTCIIFLFFAQFSFSQNDYLPKDYLSKEFHKERREALRQKMPPNSVAVFFANPVRNRANDVEYIYHQDPNFYYLTGYKEPHAVLLIFSENQSDGSNTYNEVIYVQEKDPRAEQWTGKRLGVEGTKEKLGFKMVYNGSEFSTASYDFKKFDKVLIFDFHDDYRDSGRNNADLYDLVQQFKGKANYDKSLLPNPAKDRIYQMIKATEIENSANVAQNLGRYMDFYPELKEDELLKGYQTAENNELRKEFKQKISLKLEAPAKTNIDISTLGHLMGSLRETKLPEEMKLLKKAIEISAMGQREIMKAMHPNMSEAEIQGVHEFVYKKYGAEYEGYPSIVGGGHNGCILHYIENNKTKVGNDLVLMDLGAEYHGYTADVTRTIPANGKFSPEQRAIYDIVYDAQEAGIALVKLGSTFAESHAATRKIVNEGLFKLGIIKSIDEQHNYYPHGSSHHIGLDVHDAGSQGEFKVNMVLTVEPGIYIPENSPCDKKWWGIAVRIEDDILVTENGPVNLSAAAPRKAEEIEKLMKETSVLNSFELPKLDE